MDNSYNGTRITHHERHGTRITADHGFYGTRITRITTDHGLHETRITRITIDRGLHGTWTTRIRIWPITDDHRNDSC